ncbi:uncharacterized protein [Equus asinus]|uniref:uncharacterized protein n=1 Tax=Equus asinus TaxID=9793 RepID=UPI0038F7B5CA
MPSDSFSPLTAQNTSCGHPPLAATLGHSHHRPESNQTAEGHEKARRSQSHRSAPASPPRVLARPPGGAAPPPPRPRPPAPGPAARARPAPGPAARSRTTPPRGAAPAAPTHRHAPPGCPRRRRRAQLAPCAAAAGWAPPPAPAAPSLQGPGGRGAGGGRAEARPGPGAGGRWERRGCRWPRPASRPPRLCRAERGASAALATVTGTPESGGPCRSEFPRPAPPARSVPAPSLGCPRLLGRLTCPNFANCTSESSCRIGVFAALVSYTPSPELFSTAKVENRFSSEPPPTTVGK